ncbi:hypothetical protein HPB50_019833 [Hyalomma asiaticum]|uniref:Uncharacterized protein n=1 Tax=Hyalomma asiaticum TaxID=266040 RepID=A0ACB7RVQ8_HYAAI|nr:hypothetical protein HPB50_019833 [Hyalomma asiaticum]
MADSERNAMEGDSVNESDRTRELMLEIEALKLKLELEKLSSSHASSEEPAMWNRHTGLALYAKELKALFAPMPTNEPMIAAWFKNVDALFAALSTPEEGSKEADKSWSQVTARLETVFTYYLRSREVQSFESLQESLIADRLKQLMLSDLRSLVTQQEEKGWLKPKDIAS